MASDDVGRWIDGLVTQSQLIPNLGETWVDVAVVDQFAGPTAACEWLEFARDGDISRAWRRGCQPGELATPVGWKPTAMRFHPNGEVDGMAFLPSGSRGVETTMDTQTGEVSYITQGVVSRRVVQDAWLQYLIDEVEVPSESRETIICMMSADYDVVPIAALALGVPRAEAVAELARDINRGALRLPAVGVPIGVGLSTYGPLNLTVSFEGGDERPLEVDGHYILAVHPGQDPFLTVKPQLGDRLMTSRRLPSGTEGLYAALEHLLTAYYSLSDHDT